MPRKPVRLAPGPSLRAVGEAGATGVDLDLCMAAVASAADKAAFGRLVQHFAPRLIGFFARRESRIAAEALALDTLTALWRDAATYDPRRTTLAGFVFVLARNLLAERDLGPDFACAAANEEGLADDEALAQATTKLRAALEGKP